MAKKKCLYSFSDYASMIHQYGLFLSLSVCTICISPRNRDNVRSFSLRLVYIRHR